MMIGARSSSTQVTLGSPIDMDGHIIRSERSHRLHEETNNILKVRVTWLPIDSPLLRGCAKKFKLEHNSGCRKEIRSLEYNF
jgi:hypothetical protein